VKKRQNGGGAGMCSVNIAFPPSSVLAMIDLRSKI
jgi:hypothetical protein